MIKAFFVNGNIIENESKKDSSPEEFIQEYTFATMGEVEAFRAGIEAAARYDDTAIGVFIGLSEAVEYAQTAIDEWWNP